MSETAPPPLHMDRWSRNERLYHQLLGMGLVVNPIRLSSDPSKIDYLHVSCDLPFTEQAAQGTAECSVRSTVQRDQVADMVATAERSGDGVVIHLPPVR